MNDNDWTAIPEKLKGAGFTVSYDRVSYDPKRPLWSARASRDERECSASGETLRAAFLELERLAKEIDGGWREPLAEEMREPACATETA